MCKHAVKKLYFVIRYVPDRYKTQHMWDTAILENSETLESVLDCYKNQEMCDKAVDNYRHALKFVPDCYKTQNMCDKAVIFILLQRNLFLNAVRLKKCMIKLLINVFCIFFYSWPYKTRYKTQEMCDRLASEDHFLIVY